MKKSNEERLTDIGSSITRLAKMQGCVFKALLILHKTSGLFGKSEQFFTEANVSLESYHRHGDRSLTLMFGAIAVMGIATSMLAVYFTTLNSNFVVMSTVCFISFFILLFFGFLEHRHANSQFQIARRALTEAKEIVVIVRETVAASDKDMTHVVAEWKELVPDDLVSEPKLED